MKILNLQALCWPVFIPPYHNMYIVLANIVHII